MFIYVNQRPINYVKSELKDLVACIRDKYREAIGLNQTNKKNPFMYVDIQVQPDEYDGTKMKYKAVVEISANPILLAVNVEPNKTIIYFHNKDLIYNLVKQMLNKAYPSTLDALFSKQTPSDM